MLLLEGWARDGLTDDQIASNCGIVRSTLAKWKNEHSDISDALKKGKEVVDYQVENALLKNALTGNVTAQIYWLNNRRPKNWRNNRDDYTEPKADDTRNEAKKLSDKELKAIAAKILDGKPED